MYKIVANSAWRYGADEKTLFATNYWLGSGTKMCFACYVDGWRECYFCGNMHKTSTNPEFMFTDVRDIHPTTDMHYTNPCQNELCMQMEKAKNGELKYPGYTKDMDSVRDLLYGDIEEKELAIDMLSVMVLRHAENNMRKHNV